MYNRVLVKEEEEFIILLFHFRELVTAVHNLFPIHLGQGPE